jgi:cytoskeletal protein CcmA (bactofilin family)
MISNSVAGDLLVAGGQINVLSSSVIGKDVEIAGGTINYSGENNGKLSINGGDVFINGKINGDMSINAQSIKLGPNAVITGNFNYSSPKEAILEQGAKVNGTVNFNKIIMPENKDMNKGQAFLGFITFGLLMKSLMIILTVLVFAYFFRKQTEAVIKESSSNFWKNAGKGLILFIVVPVAIILSFITVVGSMLGVATIFVYAALLITSSIIANLLFAQLCMKFIFKKGDKKINWWIIVLSVLVFELISFIPFIGWIFKFIIFLATLSGLANYIFNKLKD